MQSPVLLLVLATLTPGLGGPLPDTPAFPTQENFNLDRFMGKWYDIAVASTCPWLLKYKDHASVGTLQVNPGDTSDTINLTRTSIRHGTCKQKSMVYQLTETPGKFFYHHTKWAADMDTYVLHTNYDEYAIVLKKKQKKEGHASTSLKLYGRTTDLRSSLIDEFTQLAKEQGISDESIFTLKKAEECVPGEQVQEPQPKRARRNVILPPPEEGSGDDEPVFWSAASCLKALDRGPCFGMVPRYYYNSSLMACQAFDYGGCLGNENNFVTEKECLQRCRTEAACRLPISTGPCVNHEQLWAFDSTSGKCVTFQYGGCQGNGNKFYTQSECEEYCGVMKDGEEELLKVN